MHVNRLPLLALVLPLLGMCLALGVGSPCRALADEAKSALKAPRVPILYEVDTRPPLYLLGTIHVGHPDLNDHPPVVQRALAECEALYTELAFEPEELTAQADSIFLPDGGSLQRSLPASLYERTRKLLAQRDIKLQALDNLKVWALWLQVGGLATPKRAKHAKQGLPMDVLLYRSAKKDGKIVGGLELASEQVAVFDGLTQAQQVRLLEDALDEVEAAWRVGYDPLAALIKAYRGGDPDTLVRTLFSRVDLTDPFSREVYLTRLLDRRNVRMVRRMLTSIQGHPDKTTVVAVGTAHLPGRNGILSLLTRTGFRVRKLETPADMLRPWPRARPTPVVRSRPRRRYRRIGPFCVPLRCCPPR